MRILFRYVRQIMFRRSLKVLFYVVLKGCRYISKPKRYKHILVVPIAGMECSFLLIAWLDFNTLVRFTDV